MAEAELRYRGKFIRLKCLVDISARRGCYFKEAPKEIRSFVPYKEDQMYELKGKERKEVKITGQCLVKFLFRVLDY